MEPKANSITVRTGKELKLLQRAKIRTLPTCDVCHKVFLKPYNLKRHKPVHDKPKTFEMKRSSCKVCNKKFQKQYNLKRHELTHKSPEIEPSVQNREGLAKNVKKYTCGVCQKQFLKLYNLKCHKLLHRSGKDLAENDEEPGNEEQKFSCEFCGLVFTRKASLKAHIVRKHTQRYQFSCELCGKQFKIDQGRPAHPHETESPRAACDMRCLRKDLSEQPQFVRSSEVRSLQGEVRVPHLPRATSHQGELGPARADAAREEGEVRLRRVRQDLLRERHTEETQEGPHRRQTLQLHSL